MLLSTIMFSKLIQAVAILGITVTCSNANNIRPRYANTTTPTPTSSQSHTSSSSHPASITSCGGPVDVWDTYMNPSLLSLYYSSPALWSSIWISEQIKLNSEIIEFDRLIATSTITNSVAYSSYFSSVYAAFQSDVSYVWGPGGAAVLNFQAPVFTTNGCLFTTCTNQYFSQKSSFVAASPSGFFFYTAQPPCCGQCTISGAAVQLAYWPTPAPSPPTTELIDAWGTTYYSPWVYVWFTDLYASDNCGNVGKTSINAFGTFWPTELSSSPIPTNQQTLASLSAWTSINFADFGPQCFCTPPNCKSDSVLGWLTNTCTPQLSMPSQVRGLDPAWATCALDFGGVFDPPIALTVQPGLALPKSTAVQTTPSTPKSTPTPTDLPVNGPTPTPPLATLTVTSQIANPLPTIVPLPPSLQPSSTASGINRFQSPEPETVSSVPSTVPAIPTPAPPAGVTTAAPSSIVINGQTITANSQGAFVVGTATITTNSQGNVVIAGQTVTAGGQAITVSGSTISIAPVATEVVFGGTSTTKLGSIIMSFFGVGGSSTTTTTQGTGTAAAPAQYTGAGGKRSEAPSWRIVLVAILSMTMVWI